MNIKDMGDVYSGNTSEIVQTLLVDIMKCFLHTGIKIRTSALQVVSIILRQGLVHPVQVCLFFLGIFTSFSILLYGKKVFLLIFAKVHRKFASNFTRNRLKCWFAKLISGESNYLPR
jgi:hypothetical protein